MLKIVEIISVEPYNVICKFNTGEIKIIALENCISTSSNNVDKAKLLNKEFFKQVQIGKFGELFWADSAFMKNEKNELIPCEFDLSPEFVYHNSRAVELV